MSAANNLRAAPDYREWQLATATVHGARYKVATKPGAFAHGHTDVAAMLLAEHVRTSRADSLVLLNCGSALLAAVAEVGGDVGQVLAADRNVISFEAARRTIAANALSRTTANLGAGLSALPADARASVVAIRIPHEKLALHQLLFDAFALLAIDGRCYLAGATNEGAKSAERAMQQIFGNARVVAHDSGNRIVMSTKRTTEPNDANELRHALLHSDAFHQLTTTLRGEPVTLFSRPGVFSWDHADEATEILAATMQINHGESVLDLGCGAGALGLVAARLSQTGAIAMVDADSESVRSARESVRHAGLTTVRVIESDVALAVRDQRFDVVVTNPPFHVGKSTDLSVPMQFIEESWEVLAPRGRLYLVANRTLPYERAIESRFGNAQTVHDGQRFKVLSATRG